MARPLRLELAGSLYHVTSRGDGREDIYLSDEDRVAWLDTLGQVCVRFNWVCHNNWGQSKLKLFIYFFLPPTNRRRGVRMNYVI